MKKKYTSNYKVIYPEIYPYPVYVFKGKTFEESKESLFKINKDIFSYINEKDFNNAGLTVMTPGGEIIILISEEYMNDVGIIAHEAFHATQFILEKTGCYLTPDTSEPYAYLLQYITDKIYKI